MHGSTRLTRAGATAVAALALLAAGCGSGSKSDSAGTFVPGGGTATTPGGGATTTAPPTTSSSPASRSDPLAQRVFKLTTTPQGGQQRAAVDAMQRYLDGLITAFATNNVGTSGVGDYASPSLLGQAKGVVADQVRKGFVLYGPYTFTIDPKEVGSSVGVINVCIDESQTRRHDAGSDKAGSRNAVPFVRFDYTLSRDAAGRWLVDSSKGGPVDGCDV